MFRSREAFACSPSTLNFCRAAVSRTLAERARGERPSDLRTHRVPPCGAPRRTPRSCASSRWKKVLVHVEEAHRTYPRLDASGWVHHVGQPIANVFEVNEPFLPSMCIAPYDREKHCLRAVDVVATMRERLSHDGTLDYPRATLPVHRPEPTAFHGRAAHRSRGCIAPSACSRASDGTNTARPNSAVGRKVSRCPVSRRLAFVAGGARAVSAGPHRAASTRAHGRHAVQ